MAPGMPHFRVHHLRRQASDASTRLATDGHSSSGAGLTSLSEHFSYATTTQFSTQTPVTRDNSSSAPPSVSAPSFSVKSIAVIATLSSLLVIMSLALVFSLLWRRHTRRMHRPHTIEPVIFYSSANKQQSSTIPPPPITPNEKQKLSSGSHADEPLPGEILYPPETHVLTYDPRWPGRLIAGGHPSLAARDAASLQSDMMTSLPSSPASQRPLITTLHHTQATLNTQTQSHTLLSPITHTMNGFPTKIEEAFAAHRQYHHTHAMPELKRSSSRWDNPPPTEGGYTDDRAESTKTGPPAYEYGAGDTDGDAWVGATMPGGSTVRSSVATGKLTLDRQGAAMGLAPPNANGRFSISSLAISASGSASGSGSGSGSKLSPWSPWSGSSGFTPPPVPPLPPRVKGDIRTRATSWFGGGGGSPSGEQASGSSTGRKKSIKGKRASRASTTAARRRSSVIAADPKGKGKAREDEDEPEDWQPVDEVGQAMRLPLPPPELEPEIQQEDSAVISIIEDSPSSGPQFTISPSSLPPPHMPPTEPQSG